MQKINKGEPIPEYQQWVNKNKTTNWDDLPSTISCNVRSHILKNEQDDLCGYTELPLTMGNSHIDHFRKRNGMGFEKLTFDWNNFVVASVDEDFGAKYKDGRESKLTKEDYNIIFNPVECGMDSFVQYETDGMMTPIDKNNQRVWRTIAVFKLNHNSLKGQRKKIMLSVNSCYNGGMSDDEIRNWLRKEGFPSVVEWKLKVLHSQGNNH